MRLVAIALAVCVVLSGCGAPATPRTVDAPSSPATSSSPSASPTPMPGTTIVPSIAATWPAPDDRLTPGLVADSCSYPRDTDERDVSASTKRAAAKRYNYTGPSGLQYLEYDHRVPFSLCGANTVANIWPEPVDGIVQRPFVANRKDQLEAYAAREVRTRTNCLARGETHCGGWTLTYAQEVFLGDWRDAWCRYRSRYASAGVVC